MPKKETSKKQKKSETKFLKEYDPSKSKLLRDPKVVREALLDCIQTGDTESFREVLSAHLVLVNKTDLAKKSGISRRTIYDMIDPTKDFNPELSTISALIRSLAA